MSDNSLRVHYTLDEESGTPAVVRRTIRDHVLDSSCESPIIERDGQRYIANVALCDIEKEAIFDLLCDIEILGAKDVCAIAYYDNVGASSCFKVFDGRMEEFESIDECNDFIREKESQPRNIIFDYGKPRTNKTALIRLDVVKGEKREPIAELFRKAVGKKTQVKRNKPSMLLALPSGSDLHDVRWCAFKRKDETEWYHGPDALINGLVFYYEESNSIYLGFDLDGIEPTSEYGWENDIENLVYVLYYVDGVKKVWVKLRPFTYSACELYTYYPGTGDSVFVTGKVMVADSEWPRLRG